MSVDTNTDLNYDVVEYSIEAFTEEVVSRVKDGWVPVKGSGDAIPFTNTFTVSMYRNAATVKALKATVDAMTEAPKPTRAEILQKARDAKAAKTDSGAKLDTTKII